MSTAETGSVKTAIVTGAGGGIGRAVSIKLASQGCNLVLNYAHNEKAAKETAEACEAYGVKTICVQADISSEEDCDRLFAEAKNFSNRVDILVNNAGITRDMLLLRMKTEEFDEVIQTNLRGVFFCMKRACRVMLRQKYGRIINISSVVGVHGNAGQVNYAAAKAGVIGMTKSLAKELAGKNVTVNAVAPGMIETAMTAVLSDEVKTEMCRAIPMGRPGTADEVAGAVAFLAGDDASYITGQVLGVDGGMGM